MINGQHHSKETKAKLRDLAICQWNNLENKTKWLESRPKKGHLFYVYGYFYPDGRICYVGKGRYQRHRGHLNFAKSSKSLFHYHNPILINICRKIMREEQNVVIKKLFKGLSEQEAFNKECELVELYGKRCDGTGILANFTNGGEGNSGYLHTDEWKLARSKAMKKMWETEEHRNKITFPTGEDHQFFGKKHTEESLQIMREKRKRRGAMKGMVADLRKVKLANDTWRGQHHTEESLKKISEASKKCWQDPEFRKKREENRLKKKEARLLIGDTHA